MKIIQSFWSLPTIQNHRLNDEGRFAGGWMSEKHHAMSWALSCLQWKKYYDDVTLYTDKLGKEWLINKLELPYSKVVCELDDLNSYNPLLWALPKVHVYSQQKEPFLHVDGDVFIWEKLSDNLVDRPLICQNIEYNHEYYQGILSEITSHFTHIPDFLAAAVHEPGIVSINAGIIGGHDLGFFKEYTAVAQQFIHDNATCLASVNTGMLNIIFEQLFFYELAKQKDVPIATLLNKVSSNFSELLQFSSVPLLTKYIHIVGFAKKSNSCCRQLEAQLQYLYPAVHQRIEAIYAKSQTSASAFALENQSDLFACSYLNGLSGAHLVDSIETALETLNTESTELKMLCDLHEIDQASTALQSLQGEELNAYLQKRRTQNLDINFNADLNTFKEKAFEIDQRVCRMLYLHHDFSTLNLPNDIRLVAAGQKMLSSNSLNNIQLLFLDDYGNIKFETLDGWQKLLIYFDDSPLQINELVKLVEAGNAPFQYQGTDLALDIVRFVSTNLHIYNLLKVADTKLV